MQLPAGIEGPDGSTLIKPTAQILKIKPKQARKRPLTVLLGIIFLKIMSLFYLPSLKCRHKTLCNKLFFLCNVKKKKLIFKLYHPVFFTCSRTAGEIYQFKY